MTDALFDSCVCLRQRPALARHSPIVRHVARDPGAENTKLQHLARPSTCSGFRLLFCTTRDTSFSQQPRVTLNEQADQHPSLGARLLLIRQSLTVLHLPPVTRLNQNEALARADHIFHQPGNDTASIVFSNMTCSLGNSPDGLTTAVQAGTRLRMCWRM